MFMQKSQKIAAADPIAANKFVKFIEFLEFIELSTVSVTSEEN